MTISLTQSAAKQIRSYLDKDQASIGLRFGVRTSGCSGYAYKVEITDSIENNDEVCESQGIQVVVDKDSLPFVAGTVIDYAGDKFSQTFVFTNPNETASCGCGESFTTKH